MGLPEFAITPELLPDADGKRAHGRDQHGLVVQVRAGGLGAAAPRSSLADDTGRFEFTYKSSIFSSSQVNGGNAM
jgi:hypothetical protein